MRTVSPEILRAGRALIGWSQSELASRAQISVPTLRRMETDQVGVLVESIVKVQLILESEGVEFFPETENAFEGVRKRKPKPKPKPQEPPQGETTA